MNIFKPLPESITKILSPDFFLCACMQKIFTVLVLHGDIKQSTFMALCWKIGLHPQMPRFSLTARN